MSKLRLTPDIIMVLAELCSLLGASEIFLASFLFQRSSFFGHVPSSIFKDSNNTVFCDPPFTYQTLRPPLSAVKDTVITVDPDGQVRTVSHLRIS